MADGILRWMCFRNILKVKTKISKCSPKIWEVLTGSLEKKLMNWKENSLIKSVGKSEKNNLVSRASYLHIGRGPPSRYQKGKKGLRGRERGCAKKVMELESSVELLQNHVTFFKDQNREILDLCKQTERYNRRLKGVLIENNRLMMSSIKSTNLLKTKDAIYRQTW